MTRKLIKPVMSAEEAATHIKEGSSLMVGGFNYGGVPYTLIDALVAQATFQHRMDAHAVIAGHACILQGHT